MDASRFDQIAKSLSTTGTRRTLVRLLSALPLAGAVALLLGDEPTQADGSGAIVGGHRHRRTPNRHHHHPDQHRHRHKHKGKHTHHHKHRPSNPCKGQPDGTCCAGKTGQQWCQAGACVAVPASGTIFECQGACGFNPGRPVTVCGAKMFCPPCSACDGAGVCSSGCPANLVGPLDTGLYCVRYLGLACTDSACTEQCCFGNCVEVCSPSP